MTTPTRSRPLRRPGAGRPPLTYANVMASIAVFIALGGAAYAGVSRNSVDTRHLKRGAVTTPKLAAKAVKTPKLAGGAVKPGNLAKAAVLTNKLAPDAVKTGRIDNSAVMTPDLAPGAVKTGRIANNAVTGPKVRESTLGTVPNANRVDGVDVIPVFARLSIGENQPLTSIGGLDLSLECTAGTAFIRLSFGQPPTAYRRVRIDDSGDASVDRNPNKTSGAVGFGDNLTQLITAASGGRALNAQIQGWNAGENPLGQMRCLYSGFVLIER